MTWHQYVSHELRQRAFLHQNEFAWTRADALKVIDQLTSNSVAVLGIEIWIPADAGPEIPAPFAYTWTPKHLQKNEDTSIYVVRANESAREYVTSFDWDAADCHYFESIPYFNITA